MQDRRIDFESLSYKISKLWKIKLLNVIKHF
jgi:hypothetical protein